MANPYPRDLEMTADVPQMYGGDTDNLKVMVGRVQRGGIVNSVEFVPSRTLAGTATNYRTYTLYNRRSDGSGTTAIAAMAMTSASDFSAGLPRSLTITSGAATLAVGDILEFDATATAAGAPVPGGRLIVQQSNGT